jgi:hypothetical protein
MKEKERKPAVMIKERMIQKNQKKRHEKTEKNLTKLKSEHSPNYLFCDKK